MEEKVAEILKVEDEDDGEEEFQAASAADSEDGVDSWRHLRSDELLEDEEEEVKTETESNKENG